jgi:hypothetical protein
MPRRKKPQAAKKSWHWYANMGLNVVVALSMILGTVFLFTGNTFSQQRGIVLPTDLPGGDIPTLAPTIGVPISTIVPAITLPASTPAATPTR